MEDRLREIVNEPTFGDKVTPILKELEDAIIDRTVALPGDVPCYGEDAIMSALVIFQDVLLDKAFGYWNRLNLSFEQMKVNSARLGDELRLMVLRYADYNTLKRK